MVFPGIQWVGKNSVSVSYGLSDKWEIHEGATASVTSKEGQSFVYLRSHRAESIIFVSKSVLIRLLISCFR